MDAKLLDILTKQATEKGRIIIADELTRCKEQCEAQIQMSGNKILNRLHAEIGVLLKNIPELKDENKKE